LTAHPFNQLYEIKFRSHYSNSNFHKISISLSVQIDEMSENIGLIT